jgi:hypothetical protein
VTKKKFSHDKPLFFLHDNSTYLYMGDTLLMHVTVNEDNPFSNTTPPLTNTRKRTLEASAVEFIEKGWKLLFKVHFIKEYTTATVLSQPVDKAKSIYTYSLYYLYSFAKKLIFIIEVKDKTKLSNERKQ